MNNRKLFDEEERTALIQNKYVKNVSVRSIAYTDEFKKIFIEKYKEGKKPEEIFTECGFDVDILGKSRIKTTFYRFRAMYENNGVYGLIDKRKMSSWKSKKDMNIKDKIEIERVKAINITLMAENELLKKVQELDKIHERKKTKEKMELIKSIIEKYELEGAVKSFCSAVNVSRASYCDYFENKKE